MLDGRKSLGVDRRPGAWFRLALPVEVIRDERMVEATTPSAGVVPRSSKSNGRDCSRPGLLRENQEWLLMLPMLIELSLKASPCLSHDLQYKKANLLSLLYTTTLKTLTALSASRRQGNGLDRTRLCTRSPGKPLRLRVVSLVGLWPFDGVY